MNKDKIIISLILLVAVVGVISNLVGKSETEEILSDQPAVVLQNTQTEFVLDNPSVVEIGEWISSQDSQTIESIPQEDNEQEEEKVASVPEDFPQSINVDMSYEQYDTFLLLDAYMADPTYVSTLNIAELSQSTEFKSLPEAVQLLLASKAVSHLNNGGVSREVFYGSRVEEKIIGNSSGGYN